MQSNQLRKRGIALFFVFVFMQTLIPYNVLLANNNGPNAPEAAAFEPVDATDMVNLVTGDFSYVMPLLNVPSPEGGYPLALSYHAGIAMDQEASWVGLGWSLNPGAINRSVNGFPDDWRRYGNGDHEKISSYYDLGTESFTNISTGYSFHGIFSVGNTFSFKGNRAIGGAISFGVGAVSGNVNYYGGKLGGGIALGYNSKAFNASIGYSTNSGFNSNIGLGDSVYGLSVGFNKHGISSASFGSLGLTFNSYSNNTLSINLGSGYNINFNQNMSYGEKEINNNLIPIIMPTYLGVFSLTIGSRKVSYRLQEETRKEIQSPLYFHDEPRTYDVCYGKRHSWEHPIERTDVCHFIFKPGDSSDCPECFIETKYFYGTQFDAYSLPINEFSFKNNYNVERASPVLVAKDNFSVSAQGLSGNFSVKFNDLGMLYTNPAKYLFDGREMVPDFDYMQKLSTIINDNELIESKFDVLNYTEKPYFTFDNYVNDYSLNLPYFKNNETDFMRVLGNVNNQNKVRKQQANFIEHFTNYEINEGVSGFIKPIVTGFNRQEYNHFGVGGFRITTADGKTYHYSLPVYNHAQVTRHYDLKEEGKVEKDSHADRIWSKYATNWLLTAITGPDYVDTNSNSQLDEKDKGYFVSFEYGKWSNSRTWKSPNHKYSDEYEGNKFYTFGFKDAYYLNKIKTRTHTALFFKKVTDLERSPQITYPKETYTSVFPGQNKLILEKILIVKNEFDTIELTSATDSEKLAQEKRVDGIPEVNFRVATHNRPYIHYNLFHREMDKHVILDTDVNESLQSNALKAIELKYDLDHADQRPYLKKIFYGGKGSEIIVPPYVFDYNDKNIGINYDQLNRYGFYEGRQNAWSLSEVKNPLGASLNIEYESHEFKPIIKPHIPCTQDNDKLKSVSIFSNDKGYYAKIILEIEEDVDVDKAVEVNVKGRDCNFNYSFDGVGSIQKVGNKSYHVYTAKIDDIRRRGDIRCTRTGVDEYSKVYVKLKDKLYEDGGIRVKSIALHSGLNEIINNYSYSSFGLTYYLPSKMGEFKEIPYSSELPAPKILYSGVNVTNHSGYQSYHFNVYEFNNDELNFGNFYSINEESRLQTDYTNKHSEDIEQDVGHFKINDFTSEIGRLIKSEFYNSEGQKIYSKEIDYYNPLELPIGRMKESSYSAKSAARDDVLRQSFSFVEKTKYPSLIKKERILKNGFIQEKLNSIYDPILGIPKELIHTFNGKSSKVFLDYARDQYPSMGSKVDDINNKNMLSQIAQTTNQLLVGQEWKTISSEVTTWKDWGSNIWRKHQSYVYKGDRDSDGVFTSVDEFNWSEGASQTDHWLKTSEVTRYNDYSKALESFDVNGDYAATKMGDNDSKIYAVGNARYSALFFSSAEDYTTSNTDIDEVQKGTASLSTDAHTGQQSLSLSANQTAFKVSPGVTDKYKVSVWAKGNYANVKLQTANGLLSYDADEVLQAGDWYQLNYYTPSIAANSEMHLKLTSGSVKLDDFRAHPITATMSTYVYNAWDELSYILDGTNLATHYVYDSQGRLSQTFVEVLTDGEDVAGGFVKAKEYNYRYKRLTDYDRNKNGQIDEAELYDEVFLSLGLDSATEAHTKVRAHVSGGTGNFVYKWGQSNNNSIGLGSWTTTSFINIHTRCGEGGRVYYRCQVKDLTTGVIKEASGTHQITNCDDDGGGGNPIQQQ